MHWTQPDLMSHIEHLIAFTNFHNTRL
jgi:hypothetical protein